LALQNWEVGREEPDDTQDRQECQFMEKLQGRRVCLSPFFLY
jgi:hypothetical protein